jgi:hypothetical protein
VLHAFRGGETDLDHTVTVLLGCDPKDHADRAFRNFASLEHLNGLTLDDFAVRDQLCETLRITTDDLRPPCDCLLRVTVWLLPTTHAILVLATCTLREITHTIAVYIKENLFSAPATPEPFTVFHNSSFRGLVVVIRIRTGCDRV